MTIKASQVGRFNASRHGLVPQLTSAISGLVTGVIMVAGAWPGWMSPDSLDMRNQAESGIFTTWHTPVLSWLWGQMSPEQLGPIGPFVIQQTLLWIGITLVAVSLTRYYGLIGTLFPPSMLLFDHLWVSAWIWKDAAALSLVVLALGLAAMGWTVERWGMRLALFAGAVFAASLVSATRMYMLPTVVLMAASLILMFRASSQKWAQVTSPTEKPRVSTPLFVAVVLVGIGVPWLIEREVVQPASATQESAVYLQDLARLQCSGVPGPEPGADWIPDKFVIQGDGDVCDDFDLTRLNPLVFSMDPKTRVRFAADDSEIRELRRAWMQALPERAPVLAGARLMLAADFLRVNDGWVLPRLSTETPFFLAEGGVGLGKDAGWPSSGGLALMMARFPSLIVDKSAAFQDVFRSGLSTSILLPLAGLCLLFWRRRTLWMWSILGACVPVVWILNFAGVSPWNDTRYVAPAAAWGIIFTAILVLVVAPNSRSRPLSPEEPANDDSSAHPKPDQASH